MANGEPTIAAMLLLRGCLAPQPVPNETRRFQMPDGGFRSVFDDNTKMFGQLYASEMVWHFWIKKRKHKKSRGSEDSLKRSYVTSPKGIMLLKAWAERKQFKPFYDAFCGHIKDLDYKRLATIQLLDGKQTPIPPWIHNRERLAYDESLPPG